MSATRKLHSKPGASGKISPRTYTKAEVSAAKRIHLAHGNLSSLGGPIFWASGDYVPNHVRQMLADYQLVNEAIEREWDNDA